MSNYMTYADAESVLTEYANRIKALNGAYVIRGSVTFANLPTTLTKAMNGYVYNITEDFVTDARFIEGTGKAYNAGTNVVVVNNGNGATPDMKFDVVGSFVDVDAIEENIQAVRDSIVGEFSDSTAYVVGDVVTYNKKIYKFKAAHAAGDWDATQVDEKTVVSLIKEAEPQGLTTAQIEALVALLD